MSAVDRRAADAGDSLADRFRSGDERALRELYDRYAGAVLTWHR